MTRDIIVVKVADLIAAAWNYKVDMSKEQMERLAKSIERDKSLGVPCVREIDGGRYEVIDGNHRLEAVILLGWEQITVENYGPISIAEAITVARRRNHQWADDDPFALAKLMSEVVFPEIPVDNLAGFMPENLEQLQGYDVMGDFDWSNPGDAARRASGAPTLAFKISEQLAEAFNQQLNLIKAQIGDAGDEPAIAAMLQVLSKIPLKEYA